MNPTILSCLRANVANAHTPALRRCAEKQLADYLKPKPTPKRSARRPGPT